MDQLGGALSRWIRSFTSPQGVLHKSVPTSLTEENNHFLIDIPFQFTRIHPLNLLHQSVYFFLDVSLGEVQHPIETSSMSPSGRFNTPSKSA
jgi:hypothetical protein